MKKYTINDVLPIWFKWELYFYFGKDKFWEAKIDNELTKEAKISDLALRLIKINFENSEDEEIKKLKDTTYINDFVWNIENIFSDEEIKEVLSKITVKYKK